MIISRRRPSSDDDSEGYAWACSYVKFMIRTDPKRFGRFMDGLKQGLDQRLALRKASGLTFDQLQARWRTWVVKSEENTPDND